ncbi:MAG: hypothetical protein COU72_02290 [Parcubacteria group bacterium CG10_big_fil_rev_8_21_14_0_10_41_35]|nr:MAG: hypothetical protein COU72_02290 [Parcubacteria group bacterium CG10_big_fil_rev_8_21_14_0_10_41_35]
MQAQAIRTTHRLDSPREVKEQIALRESASDLVEQHRHAIQRITSGKDSRFLTVVGLRDIQNLEKARLFVEKLRNLNSGYSSLFAVAQIFCPPCDVYSARRFLMEASKAGIATGTELNSPFVFNYISDLLSWALLANDMFLPDEDGEAPYSGFASGLLMPFGLESEYKDVEYAIKMLENARSQDSFIGADEEGRIVVYDTKGSNYGHIVIRGSNSPISMMRESSQLSEEKIPHVVRVDISGNDEDLTVLEKQMKTAVSLHKEAGSTLNGVYLYCAHDFQFLEYLFRYIHDELAG